MSDNRLLLDQLTVLPFVPMANLFPILILTLLVAVMLGQVRPVLLLVVAQLVSPEEWVVQNLLQLLDVLKDKEKTVAPTVVPLKDKKFVNQV